jgi:UDP-glucose:(heptosyl)LPS alpha-1,3-glucosyltransferase
MRIGLVIERMEPWRGGAETSTAQYARELVARGCEVCLFTASRGVSEPGVQVVSLDLPATRARRAVAFSDAVTAARAQTHCDLVHSMTPLYGGDVFMPRGGTVAESIEGNLRLRRSALARDLKRLANLFNRRQRAMLRLERRLLGGPNPPARVVAVSRYVVDQLRRHYKLTPDRVREVFNAVTVPAVEPAEAAAVRSEVRKEWGLADSSFVLVFVAHNFRLKGLAQLIDAAGVMSQRRNGLDWHLLVVGRDRPGPFVSRADRWGITKRVAFVGPSERAWRFYLAADLCVLPTFYDPCSRVVLEAACLGTPTVTTAFNGAAEVIVGNDNRPPAGRVINDPHNANELATAIEAFLDPDLRQSASQAGRSLRVYLSMARHTDQMLEIYRELMTNAE